MVLLKYLNAQTQEIDTALRNHNRTVFEEMTSWIALTMHLGMGPTF